MADPSRPNEPVRNVAQAVLSMTSGDSRTKTMEAATGVYEASLDRLADRPLGPRSRAQFLLGAPGLYDAARVDRWRSEGSLPRHHADVVKVDRRSPVNVTLYPGPSLGVAAVYANADMIWSAQSSMPAEALERELVTLGRRIRGAGNGLKMPSGTELDEALRHVVSATVSMLDWVEEVMGPRTPEAVDSVAETVSDVVRKSEDLRQLAVQHMAWPSEDASQEALSLARSLKAEIQPGPGQIVRVGALGLGSMFPGTGHIQVLRRLVSAATDVVSRVVSGTAGAHDVAQVTDSSWSKGEIGRRGPKSRWHLARARSSPVLWS